MSDELLNKQLEHIIAKNLLLTLQREREKVIAMEIAQHL